MVLYDTNRFILHLKYFSFFFLLFYYFSIKDHKTHLSSSFTHEHGEQTIQYVSRFRGASFIITSLTASTTDTHHFLQGKTVQVRLMLFKQSMYLSDFSQSWSTVCPSSPHFKPIQHIKHLDFFFFLLIRVSLKLNGWLLLKIWINHESCDQQWLVNSAYWSKLAYYCRSSTLMLTINYFNVI